MKHLVEKNRPHHPFAYNIRDELSITTSANPFDYDFSPVTLTAFRKWLRTQYPDLAALNRVWATAFASWEDVRPFSTDQIKNRMASGDALPRGNPDWQALRALRFDPATAFKEPVRWNFAPWADFRTYLDLSLARVLDELRTTAHAADPQTPVGIEGTQMPSAFGGYDLWRLAGALDWVEPYDIGDAREIFGSFMPGKLFLTTVFENNTEQARRRLWHLLLEGDRGCIVWWSEDCIDWKSPDYRLTKKAQALTPALKEMTSPLAKLFLEATPQRDPIAIHYSQPSIQVDWLLESIVDGATWQRRYSSYEAEHNRLLKVRNSWLKAFQDLGYSPRFVSSQEVEDGLLDQGAFRALVLPQSLGLSDKELTAMDRFLQTDPAHVIFADGAPGRFDGHGRIRPPPALFKDLSQSSEAESSLTSRTGTIRRAGDIAGYEAARVTGTNQLDWSRWIGGLTADWVPEVRVPPEARLRIHHYRLGPARLVAFERNAQYQMSENLRAQDRANSLDASVTFSARFDRPAHVYDLRTSRYLGRTNSLSLTVQPWEPTLLALVDDTLKPGDVVTQLQALASQGEGK